MKVLFADTYYPRFLADFVASESGLEGMSYHKRMQALNSQLFATFDAYVHAWKQLGHEAEHVIVNAAYLQKKWAQDHGIRLSEARDTLLAKLPLIRGKLHPSWELDILKMQVKEYRPDILYLMDPSYLPVEFIRALKPYCRLLAGQIASPLPAPSQFSPFDIIFSSLPNLVQTIRGWGVRSEYVKLGFDSRVLSHFKPQNRVYPVTFIGGLTQAHTSRIELLNTLGSQLKTDFFGYGQKFLRADLPFMNYHGQVWGREMYLRLLQSRITLNSHIDIAGDYANNMRLFEATGCGTLLVTDYKQNLTDLFIPDKEVVVYRDSDELVDKVRYYLKHHLHAGKIAVAGQKRTLKDHMYLDRVRKITDIFDRMLKA